MDVQSVMRREAVVASDAFTPGHLGELTQLVPFEMVDEALRPHVRRAPLVAVCCGPRTLIDAVFGPATAEETTYAPPAGEPPRGHGRAG
ncbi:hypothetical protein IL992_25895 [Microbispora sp. NEAU-D428]|uniref:hypothetical protein n=1 Tax=Microbispora sitophila TaxID=2771537 RepID=UPI0018680364|nr:hypothetical protein [Microbispora sitophila]MBE3012601.1 hypothetical protein [Microbispora sitophila]